MVFGAEEDPERRLAELRRRRAELDDGDRPRRARRFRPSRPRGPAGPLPAVLADARELLSDFREVEENFRRLDRKLREQIAGWTGSKGALLDEAARQPQQHRRVRPGPQLPGLLRLSPLVPTARPSSPICSTGCGQIDDIADQDDGWPTSISTGSMPANALRPPSGCYPTSFVASSTIRLWLENRRVFDLLRSIESKALARAGRP